MKKIFAIVFAAFLVGIAASCQKESVSSEQTSTPKQYTFNITVDGQAGFTGSTLSDTKGDSPSDKSDWESGDVIFLFFKPTSGSLLTNTYAALTYDGNEWKGEVKGSGSLGDAGILSAVFVYKLDSTIEPTYSNDKWTIASGNVFYNCQSGVSYTVSGSEISASLNLEAPADFIQFYVDGGVTASDLLTCDKVKGWKDVAVGGDMSISNITCTGYMKGIPNTGDASTIEYYGRLVSGSSLKNVTCKFSVSKGSTVYEHSATPTTDKKAFSMGTTSWTKASSNMLPGLFSIAEGKQVRFSNGNLYCTRSGSAGSYSYSFAFEANQYDYRCFAGGTNDKAVLNGTTTVTPSNTSGHFEWYPGKDDYGAFQTAENIYDQTTVKLDWGVAYNAQHTGENWTTLSSDEVTYLLKTRKINNKTDWGNTFMKVTYNGVQGWIIYPDEYTGTLYDKFATFGKDEFPGDCAFLPFAGGRYADGKVSNAGSKLQYWTCSNGTSQTNAYYFEYNAAGSPAYLNYAIISTGAKASGSPVRLVTAVN